MPDLAFESATNLARMLREKRVSSRELLDLYLGRIERYNPQLNAVVTLDGERARAEAQRADDETARGVTRGVLHGLPMTVKDSYETAGMRTTCGAPALADHVPGRDADAIARLRVAGAVIFGKTNLPAFAADFQSYNDVFGTTNNPWDLSRVPGGSSGGSAAALAAGLTGFEAGSDIGGSIRNPAHYCGVYGHKPTFGLIPKRGHIPGMPGSLSAADISVLGPMGRSADDLDLGMDVLAGPDDAGAVAWKLRLPPPRRTSLRAYRIAAWLDDAAAPVDGEVLRRLVAVVESLRSAGVTVDEGARPGVTLGEATDLFGRLMHPAIAAGLPEETFEMLRRRAEAPAAAEASWEGLFARNVTQRHRDWLQANEERAQLRARWAALFRDFDALICPVAPTAAFAHDHSVPPGARTVEVDGQRRPSIEILAWAGLAGAAYLPASVAPAGLTSAGLPVGVQIIGPYLEDRTPIDIARRLADVIGGFIPPPAYTERARALEGS
ncbi:MAG: amidase [Dehalococcoidia bacterium]|nr:amidase [Dehalococcoidia bacterium]